MITAAMRSAARPSHSSGILPSPVERSACSNPLTMSAVLVPTTRLVPCVTLHRPSNVDRRDTFRDIIEAVRVVASRIPVVFPVHPRTRSRLQEFGLGSDLNGLILTEPLGYIDFLSLTSHARLILTDSGGLQEESTVLGIPCLTLREHTERPVTVTHGTNRVVGTRTADIVSGFEQAIVSTAEGKVPELWDGHAAERIARVITRFLSA